MQLICKHDPADPNHLICEAKLPWRHRIFEIGLGVGVLSMVVVSIIFFVKSGLVDKGALEFEMMVGDGKEGEEGQKVKEDISPLYSGQIELYPHTNDFGVGAFLEAEALYFTKEGEQVGRGAWPPEVGETTKLKVFLKIYGGPASGRPEDGPQDIVVIGKLGKGMEWTGFAPQGQGLSYEPAIRTVRWQVRCQVSGVRCEHTVVFEVAMVPTPSQIQEKRVLIVDNLALKYDNREILFPDIVISWD